MLCVSRLTSVDVCTFSVISEIVEMGVANKINAHSFENVHVRKNSKQVTDAQK